MNTIFELIAQPGEEQERKQKVRIGIRVKLSSFETTCFITPPCPSYPALESEVQAIRENLEDVLKEARKAFESASKRDRFGLRADMKAGEIWTIVSGILDEMDFVQVFNTLEEGKRKEVAEHVLTHCNVFSGKAAVFSSRYNDKSSLME